VLWPLGAFTTNKFCAAPVILCRERIKNTIHAVVINATNANAATGKQGYDNAKLLTAEVAKILSIDEKTVLMASTGIIGVQLPVEKMKNNLPILVKNLNSESGKLLPTAIMTTDTFPKQYALSFETSTGIYTIAGIAKGAGILAPDNGNPFMFCCNRFSIAAKGIYKIAFSASIAVSLNAIDTIDGDMSHQTIQLFCYHPSCN
jgi:glutamate N-acetyltransferase/amino-acid N-acetyltransferase